MAAINSEEHRLDSQCEPGCPLSELHEQTIDIVSRIPSLLWKAPNRWALRDEGTVWIRTEKRTQEIETAFGAHNIDRELSWVAKWLERLPKEGEYSPLYLPKTVSMEDRKDLRAWNSSVWTYMLSHPNIEVPLLEIQMLWMGGVEQYMSGLIKRILNNPDCPTSTIRLFAQHPNPFLKIIATNNPKCPVEDKVVFALENPDRQKWVPINWDAF